MARRADNEHLLEGDQHDLTTLARIITAHEDGHLHPIYLPITELMLELRVRVSCVAQ
jgi:hypothetical protein